VQFVLGIEQRVCRLTRKRRAKDAIHGVNAQLLPAWPLKLIRRTAAEAQEDCYAKTVPSSSSIEHYAGGSSWSERSFQHDENLKIGKRLGKERISMKKHTDKAAKVRFAT